jgi:hypothetical protein
VREAGDSEETGHTGNRAIKLRHHPGRTRVFGLRGWQEAPVRDYVGGGLCVCSGTRSHFGGAAL